MIGRFGLNSIIQLFRIDNHYNKDVAGYEIFSLEKERPLAYTDVCAFILVLEGTVEMQINYNKYDIKKFDLIFVSPYRLFKVKENSPNFRAIALAIDAEYMKQIFADHNLVRAIWNNIEHDQKPFISLNNSQFELMKNSIISIKKNIAQPHIHKDNWLQIQIAQLMLDISDIRSKMNIEIKNLTRKETIFQSFISLLHKNYINHRDLAFYAIIYLLPPHIYQEL